MTYDNKNSGALFNNLDKKNDRHPDFKGPINIDGKDYFLSGWNNTSSSGKKYISLKVTPKNSSGYQSGSGTSHSSAADAPVADARDNASASEGGKPFDDYDDDEIPF